MPKYNPSQRRNRIIHYIVVDQRNNDNQSNAQCELQIVSCKTRTVSVQYDSINNVLVTRDADDVQCDGNDHS